ncbi:MAG: gephyrin-like molybdotransferase Glp [Chloroflexota bacterium]
MKPFGALLSFEEAVRIIDANIEQITRVETISISDCLHRVLAQDIIASRSTPPFDRAAVDGYALKAKDTFGTSRQNPGMLKIIGVIYAGEMPELKLATGECAQIATGAKMPRGADAVVMVEDVNHEDGQIKVIKPVYPKANIAPIGEDIKKGELVLKEGIFLSPANVGVLASQGITRVSVYEKPGVAVIPTGEEIGEVGQKLKQAQIYDINSHTVGAVVRENGCQPSRLGIIGDTPGAIKAAIEAGLKADMVVFTGGSSVGERDLLFGILEEMGEVLFHGIQIKPGKPTMFGKIKGKPIFGMPGYPTSCLINAYILLLPALRKMSGLPVKRNVTVNATLGEKVPGSTGRKQFLPVRIGEEIAFPIFKQSGAITGTAKADGYIVIDENIDIMEKEHPVTVTLF